MYLVLLHLRLEFLSWSKNNWTLIIINYIKKKKKNRFVINQTSRTIDEKYEDHYNNIFIQLYEYFYSSVKWCIVRAFVDKLESYVILTERNDIDHRERRSNSHYTKSRR